MIRRPHFSAAISAVACAAAVAGTVPTLAASLPTGERTTGESLIEVATNDGDGSIVYLRTPDHVANPVNSNDGAAAPLYLVVYPTSAASSVGTLNCEDIPVENCPDHGPAIAGLAASVVPSVYGNGVVGHDHLVGLANDKAGSEWNVAWTVWVVLFTNSAAAINHVTTLASMNEAIANHDAFIFPHAITTFHCSSVSSSAWDKGTPVTG